ncbi:MAG: exo-alpha-sialidase, partial [Gaiellaceae bacterium]
DGGKTWASPRLLSAEPIRLEWLATTTRGRMLGDYMSVSWAGGRPWAILPIATRPTFGYSEAVFAATAP